MNRVYKVIWSKAKHCYVVTSEIARSVTKSASSARSAGRKGAAVLAMAALLFTAGGVLGEAANVTDVTVNKPGNVITVTKEGGDPTPFTIDNVDNAAHAKEADYATAATKATSDGDGLVIKNTYAKVNTDGKVAKAVAADSAEQATKDGKGNVISTTYVKIANARVGADGEYVKVANTVGKNLSALDTNLSALDTQVKKNTEAVAGIVEAGEKVGEKLTDLDKQVKVNADAVAAEETARKTADQNNLKIEGDDGVISKVSNDGTTSTAVNKLVLKVDGDNQITMDKYGIKVGTNSGVMDKDGFYAGGDDYEHAGAALKWDGSIKGAGGDFTVDTKGNADIGGDLTVDKNLTVNGTFDSKTLSSTLDAKDDYTTINGGNVTSEVNDKVGTVDYSAESIFNKDGSSITVRTNEGIVDSTGKSIVGAKEIRQYLGDNAKPDGSQKNVTRKMVRNDDGTFSMEDKAVDGKNKYSTVSQNAGERKVTVTDGTKTLTVTKNLTDGIVSETNDGAGNTVTLTQGMDGTYTVVTSGNSTEEIGGKKIENYNGGLATEITGDETHHVTKNQTITVTGKSSLSAADIENKASSSIWNHVGEGYNTSWKMTDRKISESIVNGTASNKENTTAEGTKRIITSEEGTGTYNQTATSNNISLKNKAEDTSFTKSESLKGEKTSVTNPNGSSTINQSAESIVNFVKNSKGHTTRTEQSAEDITNTAKNGTITNDANDVFNKGANSVINEVGANQVAVTTKSVEAAYGLDTYTTWDDKGITNNAKDKTVETTAKDIKNTATGGITNTATDKIISQIGEDGKVKSEMNAKGITNTAENGTITNKAQTVNTITENNTVTSDNGGTTFKNEDAKTPFEEGDERGTRANTKITGNKVETGKVLTDFAEVANNLDVKGSTTLGRDGYTTLTVNSESTFRDTVKMDKTLAVDGESTFNDKVTITKNGLDVTGGTTTDTLTVTGTSEFADRADFRKDVYMWGNLEVTGETRTDTLYVDHDGYVGGNLNVDGNIETHDAVLSADSRQVVTGRQLYQTNERVDRLDNRIKKVGANAAALAALRPGDFNPDDKFSIAAGFGSYRNANAAALGLFYRPNENVLLSLGTSFGDGENMVNAGVSVKFGRGKSMAERRKEMADEVSSMRDEMRSQDERIAELEEMLKKQSELIEKLSKES